MSIERVKKYLSRWGRDQDVIELDGSSATVELAAGSHNSCIGLALEELSVYSRSIKWVDVCRNDG